MIGEFIKRILSLNFDNCYRLWDSKIGGVKMINAYKEYWHNMTVMNASAKRGQYWWPQVINYLVLAIYSVVTGVNRYIEITADDGTIIKEWNAVTLVFVLLSALIWLANFTVRARRLHDRNHSNWWILFDSFNW